MDTDILIAAKKNPTGLGRRIYFKEISKFDVIAGTAITVEPGDSVRITADHTFPIVPGTDGWNILYVHENTPEMETEDIGEDGSVIKRCKIMGFHPNWSAELEEEISVDRSYLVLVERVCVDSGLYFQMGTACLGAKMKAALKSGKTREGGRFGHEVEIESVQAHVIEYTGVVTRPT